MKKINNIISFLIVVFLIGSCTPDEYSLGDIDVQSSELVEGIAFKIEHDTENPNIVYLTNLMDSKYKPLWIHPQGRSQEDVVTLNMPFAGTYNVQFGVETRGGYVYGETITFDVEEMYSGFIEDELWTLISGGQENSKTWYLDLDGEETSRFFGGPIWFFTETYVWDNLHTASGDNYIDADTWSASDAIIPNVDDNGDAIWYWKADWAGNTWMCAAADFGTMTFDLKGGANVLVDQENYSSEIGSKTGTYMLDVDEHTIKFTDVYPLHDIEHDDGVVTATEYRILYLSEDFMQILAVPEGVCYNYISKDYKDNWIAEDPEPELPEGWQDDVSKVVNYDINWGLSEDNPFNYANLDGSLIYNWSSISDYPSEYGIDASVVSSYSNFSMLMNSEDMLVNYSSPDGNITEGSYTLDDKGIYTFEGINPSFSIGSMVNFELSSESTLRITSIEKDEMGNISGMWLGILDEINDQYLCYHLIPEIISEEAEGTEISFDNTKLVFGDLETNGNLRLELYNEYGSTASNPPLDQASFAYNTRIEVTFTLSGVALVDGAQGSYQTALSYSDPSWANFYWGDGTGVGEVSVTGDGTYTVYCDPNNAGEGAVVFVVDILGLAADIVDLSAVSASVDQILVY